MCKTLFKELLTGIFISGLVVLIPTADVCAQDMRKMDLVYSVSEMEQIDVQKVVYKSTGEKELTIDLYAPPSLNEDQKLPAVIFALGYPDFNLHEMQSYISWGKLVASHDMIGINYETSDPVADLGDLVTYIRENADRLNIDENRIGIWSCSANVPVPLGYLAGNKSPFLKFGVFYYGYMPTPDGKYQSRIDSMSSKFGFASPPLQEGDKIPENLPMLVVRAGQETYPYVNKTIDHFFATSVSNNMPVTFINYSDGMHAFDIMDDKEESRRIIKQTLSFMSEHFSKQK